MSILILFFFFSSRRRHTRSKRDWSSDVCSSDLRGGYCTADDVFLHLREVLGTEGLSIELLLRLQQLAVHRHHFGAQDDADHHEDEDGDLDPAPCSPAQRPAPRRGGRFGGRAAHSSSLDSESLGRICSLRPVPARNCSSAWE